MFVCGVCVCVCVCVCVVCALLYILLACVCVFTVYGYVFVQQPILLAGSPLVSAGCECVCVSECFYSLDLHSHHNWTVSLTILFPYSGYQRGIEWITGKLSESREV